MNNFRNRAVDLWYLNIHVILLMMHYCNYDLTFQLIFMVSFSVVVIISMTAGEAMWQI